MGEGERESLLGTILHNMEGERERERERRERERETESLLGTILCVDRGVDLKKQR